MLHLAMYQPDIPQNLGAVMRLCACMGVRLHVIGPCGFPLDDQRIRRSGMDYLDHLDWRRYGSWEGFHGAVQAAAATPERITRLLLFTTRAARPYTQFRYQPGDCLLLGSESAGVPEVIHASAHARLIIPLRPGTRSLNVGMTAAMAVGEALRQISGERPQPPTDATASTTAGA